MKSRQGLFIYFLGLALGTASALAQTLYYPGGSLGTSNGSVGIGTAPTSNRLEVAGTTFNRITGSVTSDVQTGFQWKKYGVNATDWELYVGAGTTALRLYNGGDKVTFLSNGNVGVGTSTPAAKLDVAGSLRLDNPTTQGNYYATIDARYDSNHPFAINVENNTGGSAAEVIGVYSPPGGGYVNLAVGLNGNVGIGTTNPTQKLSVNGTVRAKEVIVDTGWSDYVFAPDYALEPLSEVEARIKAEKHLPGMPSAT